MIVRHKTRIKFTILFILLVGMAFVVPPGMHLEFCVGESGHFDVSLDSCRDVPAEQGLVQCGSTIGQIHHGECLDYAVACDSFEEFLSPDRKLELPTIAINKDISSAPVFLAGAFAVSPPTKGNFSFFRLSRHTLPPSHLDSLRTVVLLI
jgi:hypothetical protein